VVTSDECYSFRCRDRCECCNVLLFLEIVVNVVPLIFEIVVSVVPLIFEIVVSVVLLIFEMSVVSSYLRDRCECCSSHH